MVARPEASAWWRLSLRALAYHDLSMRRQDGLVAPLVLDGAINGAAFLAYVVPFIDIISTLVTPSQRRAGGSECALWQGHTHR
jgi:hypothetical protein